MRDKACRKKETGFRRKIAAGLVPADSKRGFLLMLIRKALRQPGLMLKMINPRRIKNCFIILWKEDLTSAINHYRLVEEYERSRTVVPGKNHYDITDIPKAPGSIEEYEKIVFKQPDAPQVSIIIPVYNQFDYTYLCLKSILKYSGDCSYEVIVANDCSTDLTGRLDEIVKGITIINNTENLRFLLNCNHAARSARGEYLLFLNNDTQVQQAWLTSLVKLMEDPCVGMAGSRLVYPDGYLQEAGGIIWKDGSAWNYGNRQNPDSSEYNYVHEADYISGASIMIRASVWREAGGFDRRFAPAYCEDSDLAFQVRKLGYKVLYQPESGVVHFEGVSNGTDVSQGQKKYQQEHQKVFYEKWEKELKASHFENGTSVFLARDRGKGRKHVLVIDHYVPQYDKDAGSRTTFMYLKMLAEKGYRITFLGDNFYRSEPYTSVLQQLGILVLYGPEYAENWKEWLKSNINFFDIFYLNRPHIAIKYIDFIRKNAGGKIIYYGHDLHFLRFSREYALTGEKKQLEDAEKWKSQELYIMRNSDMNYFPSAVECDEIRKIAPEIPVKAITAYIYDQTERISYQAQKRSGLLFVGGFGHAPNLDAVLWFLEKVYPGVHEKLQVPFYIVGSRAPEEVARIAVDGVVVKGCVSDEELQELYGSCRLAVVPLRYGAGVKGKVIEALYYGLPVITTPVGAEGIEGIEDIALVREHEEEIAQVICEIYHDVERLKELSRRSRLYVQQHYNKDAVWNIIKDDF